MKIFIKSYKKGSKSVKALKEGLIEAGIDARVIKQVNSKYVHKPGHIVVNWGDSNAEPYAHVLNDPRAVAVAANKLGTFDSLDAADVPIVPYFTNAEDAKKFLDSGEERVVYCRTILNSSQGNGIVVATNADELVDAKLYTGGIVSKKRKEFRVHVFDGKVIKVQQKRKRNGFKENPEFNDLVRNLAGGWVFTTQDVEIREETKNIAIGAVKALGLDFGAVDILETTNGKGWVLEVNTACGLEGSTVDMYVNAIKEYVGE